MSRKTFVSSFVVAACAALITASAAGQTAVAPTKVGIVNMQQAVLQTAEIKKASGDLEAKYKPRQAALEKVRKDLDEIQQKIQAGQGKLTPQAEQDLNMQGQRKQRDLQRMSQDLQEEVDAERNDILGRSSQRMQQVVRKLAEARGLDMVVDVTNTIYFKPAMELTKDAVAEFDKAYPAK